MTARHRVQIDTAKKCKDKLCYCCGRTEDITVHHLRDFRELNKANKGKFKGYILVCRSCHDFIELINNKHKAYLKQQSSENKK